VNILLNGEPEQVEDGLTVAELLRKREYDATRVAVAVNEEFLPREKYAATAINDGDAVEVVAPLQGGRGAC